MNTVTHNINKAVVLFSSPNKNGHTKAIYKKLIDNLQLETKFINVYDLKISPCIDCKACYQTSCPHNDDDMGMIIQNIHQADVIICATPIYFNGIPAPFKALMDRCQQLFVKKIILKKPEFHSNRLGILITTAGSDDNKVTNNIYDIFQMLYSCFNAEFIEHIAITNTDKYEEYDINQNVISNIQKKLNGGIKNESITTNK